MSVLLNAERTPRSPHSAALQRQGPWRRPLFQLQTLLAFALIFGGGGVGYGLSNALVQLLALVLLALNYDTVNRFIRHAPLPLLLLIGATLLLPLAQLVPLPSAMWRALPGRDLATEALQLVGDPAGMWRPLSLDPARTLAALLGTIAPATMVVLAWSAHDEDRSRVLGTLVWAGIACVGVGILQLSGAVPSFYDTNDVHDLKVIHGTFANRNSAGIFFVAALTMACAMPLLRVSSTALLLRLIQIAVLTLGTIGTMSRSSTALLLVPSSFLLARVIASRSAWRAQLMPSRTRGAFWKTALLTALVIASVTGLGLAGGGRLADTFGRFENLEDQRPEIWSDAMESAARYWPMGAGTGTFDEVFQVDESLEFVTPRLAGRAHNDFIEMAVESGVFAEALAAAWLIVVAMAAVLARSRVDRWLIWGACVGLGCFALQSGIDYPLRNQANLCVAALLFATCMTAFRTRNDEKRS